VTQLLRSLTFLMLALGVLLISVATGVAGKAAQLMPVESGDVAGLVDVGGGRRLYLECRGMGSPTVVLEAGYRSSGRVWSEDLRQSGAPRTMVLPGVAGFTRVCAYDRPGTVAPLNDNVRPSRSDPAPQPAALNRAIADGKERMPEQPRLRSIARQGG
jgi:pimeloyl-ACP methyl ester carboxylesterase